MIEICFSRSAVRASAAASSDFSSASRCCSARGRLGALGELPLALLEVGLVRGELRSTAVDLGRAQRQALRVALRIHQLALEPPLQLDELVARLLLPGERLSELGPELLELAEVRQRVNGSSNVSSGASRRTATGFGFGFAATASETDAGSSASRRDASWARSPVPKPCSVSWPWSSLRAAIRTASRVG